jgi:hypothetical protein
MNRRFLHGFLILTIAYALTGCAAQESAPPVPTATSPPPTPIPPTPVPTSTSPPPTPVPTTLTPTPEPTPTKTPVPPGIFKGCIYLEGELVEGYLTFHCATETLHYLDTIALNGCAEVRLIPGYYEVSAAFYQGVCLEGGYCSDGR